MCAVIIGFFLGWLRTFENQYLVYPPEVARHFDPELAALVGYAQHRPNLGNVEGQCPSVLLGNPAIDGLAAVDALRPEQAEAIADYLAEQEAARSEEHTSETQSLMRNSNAVFRLRKKNQTKTT